MELLPKISDYFKLYLRSKIKDDLSKNPFEISQIYTEEYLDHVNEKYKKKFTEEELNRSRIRTGIMINNYINWKRSKNRIIWRISKETSEYINSINMSFVPTTPPKTWEHETITIESLNKTPIIENFVSISCGYIDFQELKRYGMIMITKEKTIGYFLYNPNDNTTIDKWAKDLLKYVFAFSYYIENPRSEIREIGKGGKKKIGPKSKKKYSFAWQYKELNIKKINLSSNTESQPLDKTHLEKLPVIVSPHIRHLKDNKVTMIDEYVSTRWKNKDKQIIGTKIAV